VDRETFEELAMQHLDAVYRMALRLAGHPDEAQDLVQETYLKALKAADRYEERGGGMRPWLFTIVHNCFYTRVKRNKRQATPVEDFGGVASEATPPDEPPPAWSLAELDWEHVDGRLKTAIEELKPEYRTVLLLWGVEQCKYKEIAAILEVPVGTVMSRLHRARQALTETLGDLADEMGLRSDASTDG
jgi:RNA polymerase sigma-70 factor (ECF subfamily)